MAETNPRLILNRNSFLASGRILWRTIFVLLTAFLIFAFLAAIRICTIYPGYQKSIKLWIVVVSLIAVHILFGITSWVISEALFVRLETKIRKIFSRIKWLNFIVGLSIIFLFFFLILTNREYAPFFQSIWVRAYFLLWTGVIAAALLQSMVNQPFLIRWLETMLLIGLIWELMNYVTIQPGYPFSLDWSEGSWYYYASFFTSKRFYGIQINWPFLDIGRPTLLSLPFIASIRSLPFERFWQTFLWIGSSALLSLCLVRRLKIGSGIIKVLYVAFGFVWVLLGPIYFHLAISACIVLLGFNGKKPVRSLLWTLVASFWAGLMRINWIPVPAMIGATLYFLEFPWKRTTSFWNYVKRPLSLLIGGTIFGAGTFLGFALLSGRMNTMIITKVTAPFLFDRLWPNGTFQVGILPGALFLSSLLI